MKTDTFFLLMLLLPAALFAGSKTPPRSEVRAIWVTRFDYKSPTDVASIIVNCARAGFTDIFFQVRGNGTAFYPSRVEPWAFELSGRDTAQTGTNPGWNPLQLAASWAKRYRVRLHAYINVLPGWRGMTSPPRAAGQLWTAHPDWFMVDSTGARMRPTSEWYSFLNPAYPEVRNHLSQIAAELARYELAGLHLDYIRFPYDYKDVAGEVYKEASASEIKKHSEFSYDRRSVAAAQSRYGKRLSGKHWNAFRREAVSKVVEELSSVFKTRRGPQMTTSASVLADFETGYQKAFQDSRLWAKKRFVDWLVPMNYNASLFDSRLKKMTHSLGRSATGRQLVMGINCAGDPEEIRRQIEVSRRAGCRGYALFAYSHLFKDHRLTPKAQNVFQGVR